GLCCYFFFNDTATTEIYTLSLHDALPISGPSRFRTRLLPRPGLRAFLRCRDRKSTRLNSSHVEISYAVFCLKKKTTKMGRRSSIFPSPTVKLSYVNFPCISPLCPTLPFTFFFIHPRTPDIFLFPPPAFFPS